MDNGIFWFKVGSFSCAAIRDLDDWEVNVLLVDTGQHRVLIDAGCGNTVSPAGRLAERLQAAVVPPDTINTVILTHADFDHIGGVIDKQDALAFPSARLILSRQEWNFWASKPERLRPGVAVDEGLRGLMGVSYLRLGQLRDRLELVDSGIEIVPGIQIIAAPGHTPGYSIVVVASAERKLMYIGDLIRDAKDIENDSWYSVFDYDPEVVVKTQQGLLAQASREQMLVMASHMPFPGLGHVAQRAPGWYWTTLAAAAE